MCASFIAPNSSSRRSSAGDLQPAILVSRAGRAGGGFPALRAVVARGVSWPVDRVPHGASQPLVSMRNLGRSCPSGLPRTPAGRPQAASGAGRGADRVAFVEAFDNAERTPLTLDQIATLDGGSRLGLQPTCACRARLRGDDIVLALHKDRSAASARPASSTRTALSLRQGCRACAAGQPGWRAPAHNVSTTAAWSARSSSLSPLCARASAAGRARRRPERFKQPDARSGFGAECSALAELGGLRAGVDSLLDARKESMAKIVDLAGKSITVLLRC